MHRRVVGKKSRDNIDVSKDNRGLNYGNKISEDDLDKVRNHISSFPVMESHYSRASSKRLYLESGCSQSKMYDLYVEMMREKYKNSTPGRIKLSKYKEVFCTDFNLSVHCPKKRCM